MAEEHRHLFHKRPWEEDERHGEERAWKRQRTSSFQEDRLIGMNQTLKLCEEVRTLRATVNELQMQLGRLGAAQQSMISVYTRRHMVMKNAIDQLKEQLAFAFRCHGTDYNAKQVRELSVIPPFVHVK